MKELVYNRFAALKEATGVQVTEQCCHHYTVTVYTPEHSRAFSGLVRDVWEQLEHAHPGVRFEVSVVAVHGAGTETRFPTLGDTDE